LDNLQRVIHCRHIAILPTTKLTDVWLASQVGNDAIIGVQSLPQVARTSYHNFYLPDLFQANLIPTCNQIK